MKYLHFLFCLSLFTSCSGKFTFEPMIKSNSDYRVVHQNTPSIVTYYDSLDMDLLLKVKGSKYLGLDFALKNNTDKPILFDPASIKVAGFNQNGLGKTFKVYEAEAYKLKRKQDREQAAAGLAVIATVLLVAAVNEFPTPSSCNNNNDTFFLLPDDPGNPRSSEETIMDDGLLRKQTILPGQQVQGLVYVRSDPGFLHRVEIRMAERSEVVKHITFVSSPNSF